MSDGFWRVMPETRVSIDLDALDSTGEIRMTTAEGQAEVKLTDEQAEQYVARADSQLEKRLRLLEIGLLRHTALLEDLTRTLEKLTDRIMGQR